MLQRKKLRPPVNLMPTNETSALGINEGDALAFVDFLMQENLVFKSMQGRTEEEIDERDVFLACLIVRSLNLDNSALQFCYAASLNLLNSYVKKECCHFSKKYKYYFKSYLIPLERRILKDQPVDSHLWAGHDEAGASLLVLHFSEVDFAFHGVAENDWFKQIEAKSQPCYAFDSIKKHACCETVFKAGLQAALTWGGLAARLFYLPGYYQAMLQRYDDGKAFIFGGSFWNIESQPFDHQHFARSKPVQYFIFDK